MRFAACALVVLAAAAQESIPDIAFLLTFANAAHMKGDYESSRQSLL
jgi:hypothetical protein